MMKKRMQKAYEKNEEEEEDKKESEIDILMRETKVNEREKDREDFEIHQKLKRQNRKQKEETKTIIRMKWDKKQSDYSQSLIRTIFEGFGHYIPHVVMDIKPNIAFIEFLNFDHAKKAYEEISVEKNDFKLKLITNDKFEDKKKSAPSSLSEIDKILSESGIDITAQSHIELSKLSVSDLESLIEGKVSAKYSSKVQ